MNSGSLSNHLLNSPVEVGLRILFILDAVRPTQCDFQRVLIYDYLLVHSEDFPGGPPSVHPPTPFQSGELLVRRDVVARGLSLIQAKGLIEKTFSAQGIYYAATDLAPAFLDYLGSPYAQKCRDASSWIAIEFQPLPDEELKNLLNETIGRWGAEFENDAIIWEENE